MCGERVLRLGVLFPSAPGPHLWFYAPVKGDLLLRVTWLQGLQGKERRLRPRLDLARSGARFSGDYITDLEFDLKEVEGADGPPDAVLLRLVPRFAGGLAGLSLPARGLPGEVVLHGVCGAEVQPARLFPSPVLRMHCTEQGVGSDGNVWEIHQRGSVSVPMQLTAQVPVWVHQAAANEEPSGNAITLEGFTQPVCLGPDEPYHFLLRVNSANWKPREEVPFRFPLLQKALWGRLALSGKVRLVEGSKLVFGGANPRELQLQLGRTFRFGFTLTVADGEQGIEIRDYVVSQTRRGTGGAVPPRAGTDPVWLRVVAPTRESLPLTVHKRPADQVPEQLLLEVDLTRLDRQRYDGADLHGSVTLIDSLRRHWTCEVRVGVRRPSKLGHFLALDWGTSNSCGAYSTNTDNGLVPHSVSFDEHQQQTPELFPSDMYFLDLSNPEEPEFLLGQDASLRARDNPQCCLRSVKRKFQFRKQVFVMDERGRSHTYPVTEVAQLLLHRLVTLAEASLGREVHQLGLTFPTKWTVAVRNQLTEALQKLAEQMRGVRQPFEVTVLPPQIDEANAVALHLITSAHGRALPDTFYLIAYDFGGGTVDTSVLEVYLPEDPGAVRTRYVGIGGRGDFGGDDVTRAVMMVLHDRLTSALLGWPARRHAAAGAGQDAGRERFNLLDARTDGPACLHEIPLVADGEPLRDGKPDTAHWHLLGRQNWDAFWRFAELIKFDLCAAPRAETAAPSLNGAAHANHVEERLKLRLQDIQCRLLVQSSPGDESVTVTRSLDEVLDPFDSGERAAFFKQLRFDLDEVYDHPLDDTDLVNNGQRYRVRDRVDETVRELREQCSARGVEPHVIMLAGGGCRLPLIAERMGHYFPAAARQGLLDYDPAFAKRRVAYGMASYLALRQIVELDRHLARSVDVLHHPLGLSRVRRVKGMIAPVFEPIVRVGTPLNDPDTWHSFRFRRGQVRTDGLPLFVLDWQGKPQVFGHFEVPLPGPEGVGLPDAGGDEEYTAELRLCGPRHIEMCVTHRGVRLGPYLLKPAINDPGSLLQG
jgi:hypothetical protein